MLIGSFLWGSTLALRFRAMSAEEGKCIMKAPLRFELILGFCLICTSGSAMGQGIEVRVNGEPVRFSGTGPQEYRGRVLVPLRGVLEQMGAYVGWDAPARTVIATRGDMNIRLPIGSEYADVNGRRVVLDVPAMTVNGNTMVPLRFLGETLGAEVRWDARERTVSIETSATEIADRPRDLDSSRRREHRVIREPEPQPVPIPTPAAPPLQVSSISHNLREGWIRPGQRINVTLRGSPGAQAFFKIPGIAQEIPLQEASPGAMRLYGRYPPINRSKSVTLPLSAFSVRVDANCR